MVRKIIFFETHFIEFYQKQNDNLRIVQYGTEIIQNSEHFLIKDDSLKMIILSGAQKTQENQINIHKFFRKFSRIEPINGKNKAQKGFRVYFENGEYENAEIYIGKESNLIEETVLYYKKQFDVSEDPTKKVLQQPKMRMVYTKNDIAPTFLKNTFSIDRYITVNTAGKKVLKKQIRTYKLQDKTRINGKY